uniref:hypothetical protein n=1 Tax=Streptomyces tendae TaxID=1932 RepID=UPI00384F4F53
MRLRRLGGMGVGHLDPDDAPVLVVGEEEGEVPPGNAAVEYGVRREFGNDEDDGVVCLGAVRVAPLGELVLAFPNPPAVRRLATAGLAELHDEWIAFPRRYVSNESMNALYTRHPDRPADRIQRLIAYTTKRTSPSPRPPRDPHWPRTRS